ncbi:MAG: hypothetical protein M0T80_15295 [Actinomycetota bacterium]|nr:hypothetical protein [Actinomycetota bacterium]
MADPSSPMSSTFGAPSSQHGFRGLFTMPTSMPMSPVPVAAPVPKKLM